MANQNRTQTRSIDATRENSYWQQNFQNQDHYEAGRQFGDYEPAYRTGYEGYSRYGDRGFDAVQNELKSDYERVKGTSQLAWDKARGAVKAAWHHVENALPGDADRDGH